MFFKFFRRKKSKHNGLTYLIRFTYHYSNAFYRAIEFYDKAIEIEEASVILSNKALSETELGNYVSASMLCEKAIELDDENCLAYLNGGYAAIKMRKWDWALEDLEKAILCKDMTMEDMAIAYGNLSSIYISTGDDDKALKYSNMVIEKNQNLSWVYTNRVILKIKKQEVEEAMNDIAKGLKIDPKDELLIYCKGLVLVKKGNQEEGCKLMSKSLHLINDIEDEKYATISNAIMKYCK